MSSALLLFIRKPLKVENPAPGEKRNAAEGFRFLARQPVLRLLIVWIMGSNMAFTHTGVFLALIATAESRGASSTFTGLLLSIAGIGGVVGSLLASPIIKRVPPPVVFLTAAWIGPVAAVLLATVSGLVPLGVIVACVFLRGPITSALFLAYLAAMAPDRTQGRVLGAVMFMSMVAAPLGVFGVGALFDLAGPTASSRPWASSRAWPPCPRSAPASASSPRRRSTPSPTRRKRPAPRTPRRRDARRHHPAALRTRHHPGQRSPGARHHPRARPPVSGPALAALVDVVTGGGDRLPPEFFTEPDPAPGATHAANARLRATGCPVHPINYPPGGDAYVVSEYETALKAFGDPRLSKSVDNAPGWFRDLLKDSSPVLIRNMITADAPSTPGCAAWSAAPSYRAGWPCCGPASRRSPTNSSTRSPRRARST